MLPFKRTRAGRAGTVVVAAAVMATGLNAGVSVARYQGDPDSPCRGGGERLADPADVLIFTLNRLDGTPEKLDKYKGKVVLIVNTASRCGLTPQYKALQELYEQRKDDGFVVLGFPANDFGNQEPGTNEQIAAFCEQNFGVTFPMFEKITVTGERKADLFERLTGQPEPIGGEVRWNFTKFLVDRSGKVVARFEPRTLPNDPALQQRLESLLAEPKPSSSSSGS